MEEYNYDFQRVIDAEKAEEQPAAPVLPEPKKPPYGKMFAAVSLVSVAAGAVVAALIAFAVVRRFEVKRKIGYREKAE